MNIKKNISLIYDQKNSGSESSQKKKKLWEVKCTKGLFGLHWKHGTFAFDVFSLGLVHYL